MLTFYHVCFICICPFTDCAVSHLPFFPQRQTTPVKPMLYIPTNEKTVEEEEEQVGKQEVEQKVKGQGVVAFSRFCTMSIY